jgi:hypothetical protein
LDGYRRPSYIAAKTEKVFRHTTPDNAPEAEEVRQARALFPESQASFTATNNTAGEDWAFITSPVPEPSAMIGLISAGMCILACTRVSAVRRTRGN